MTLEVDRKKDINEKLKAQIEEGLITFNDNDPEYKTFVLNQIILIDDFEDDNTCFKIKKMEFYRDKYSHIF